MNPEQQDDFFIAGGTMRPTAPSYIPRPADDALYRHVLAGRLCYVLTARQMGKSSLMVRTVQRLKQDGRTSVVIDLTHIGEADCDAWYQGVLKRIVQQLRLRVDVAAWWQQHAGLSVSDRFTTFLREVVLEQHSGPLVIFIDEIDTTIKLDFKDDFFAALRAMYNARTVDPRYEHLSFVLLGVAAPNDLIHDRKRTPFNIGEEIALQELQPTDAAPLSDELERHAPGHGEHLFTHIYAWTSGHPYLTQKLCKIATAAPPT